MRILPKRTNDTVTTGTIMGNVIMMAVDLSMKMHHCVVLMVIALDLSACLPTKSKICIF